LAEIGHEITKPLDGVSLKTLLMEDHPDWEDRLIFSYWRDKISVRSQKYRLDHLGALFDIENDRGQQNDLSASFPEITNQLLAAQKNFNQDVVSELPNEDLRTFPLGHPDSKVTQIPARDGVATGNIKRSNRWPNCSFFTNWTDLKEQITWEVEVMEEGEYEVILYYTCPESDVGSTFALSFGDQQLEGKITEAADPPLRGMENDRVQRPESYVKDFKPLKIGNIFLSKGPGMLAMKALEIPGESVMDVRLLMFEKVP
jgi:hypothetical protein